MDFSKVTVDNLRLKVCEYMSPKRYRHTLGVEKCAVELAKLLKIENLGELSAAALLHDVSKELSPEEEKALINNISDSITDDELNTQPAYHSFTAPLIIMRDFPELAKETVLGAIRNHTLGAPDMSIFDEIIFVADYIEEGRIYESSINLRFALLSALRATDDIDKRERLLHGAVISAINFTVDHLEKRERYINKKTLATREAFIARGNEPLL